MESDKVESAGVGHWVSTQWKKFCHNNTISLTFVIFARKIEKQLIKWADSSYRKPLILRGARQVGKTTSIRHFAKNFDAYIELNLDIAEEKAIFDTNTSFDELIQTIFFIKQQPDKKGQKTLIFIDEIQNSPQAVRQLRYFYVGCNARPTKHTT